MECVQTSASYRPSSARASNQEASVDGCIKMLSGVNPIERRLCEYVHHFAKRNEEVFGGRGFAKHRDSCGASAQRTDKLN